MSTWLLPALASVIIACLAFCWGWAMRAHRAHLVPLAGPGHEHVLRLRRAYVPPAGLVDAFGGQLGATVLVFACDCLNGPESIDTKVVQGKIPLDDLIGAVRATSPLDHAARM